MEWTDPLDHRIVQEFEALLLKQRVRLRESVRARMTERRMGEPRRSPEDATNAVESLGEELEVAMLDRESREAAQIDAALERLARDEYGICRNCGTVIGLARLIAPRSQVVQHTHPAIFALLRAGSQCQHLFVVGQIYCQGRQNDGGIGLVSMTNAEMHAIEVQHTPMLLQRTLPPRFKEEPAC